MPDVTCVVAADALLGECPLWVADENVLFWIDIDGRTLHRHAPDGADRSYALPARPGSIANTTVPGVLLMSMEHTIGWFDTTDGTFRFWRALEEGGTGNRLNDGRTDGAGRFWVGSMWATGKDRRFTGRLHRVEADGSATTTRRNIGVSNGLAFSPDHGTMYFADSLHQVVWAYDYDVGTGEATNERVFVDYEHRPGAPDGACVDAEGHYWSAAVFGWSINRFDPAGNLVQTIDLPVQKPTMPAFGGPNLDRLYVTTIGDRPEDPPCPGQTSPGGLFLIDVDSVGLTDAPFAGRPPDGDPSGTFQFSPVES